MTMEGPISESEIDRFFGYFIPSNITFSETGTELLILNINITDPEFDIFSQTIPMKVNAYDYGKCFHRWQFLISFCSFDNSIILT